MYIPIRLLVVWGLILYSEKNLKKLISKHMFYVEAQRAAAVNAQIFSKTMLFRFQMNPRTFCYRHFFDFLGYKVSARDIHVQNGQWQRKLTVNNYGNA